MHAATISILWRLPEIYLTPTFSSPLTLTATMFDLASKVVDASGDVIRDATPTHCSEYKEGA